MMNKPQVLIVEDIEETLADYLLNLRSDEYDLSGVRSLEEALAALEQRTFDVVVTDLELFDHPDGGMHVIQKAKSLDATIGVIMVTVHSNLPTATRAVRELGARAFFSKPLEDYAACRRRIHEAIMERRYRLEAIDAVKRGGFAPIPSPYITGKPLGQGHLMFYGRDEVFDFIRANVADPARYNHLALVGPRRIGKTSILQQLPSRLGTGCLPVYINCQSLGVDPGLPAFFGELGRRIRRGLQEQGVGVSGLPELDLGSEPAHTFVERFLAPLRQLVGQRMLVLCLDEFAELTSKVQRGRLDAALFDFLHNLMQEEEHMVFILAGSRSLDELSAVSRSAGGMVQMTARQSVGVFSPELARRLVEEPVAYSGMQYQPEAVEEILRATGGYPYLIQLLCGLLINRRNEQRRNEMTVGDVKLALDMLLETPQPGFFWETLTPNQQRVLIAASRLWQEGPTITARTVEAQLQELNVRCQDWPTPVRDVLHELALAELLHERVGAGQYLEYTLSFELLSAWVRRHKTLDQVREENRRDD